MAIGWGDWGLRLVDAAADNAGLGKSSDGLVAVPEVDPRYEAIQRRQEARKLRGDAREYIQNYNAQEARLDKLRRWDRGLSDAAEKDVMNQYLRAKRDSENLNRAFSAVGAPVRSYRNYSNPQRPVYTSQDSHVDPLNWGHSETTATLYPEWTNLDAVDRNLYLGRDLVGPTRQAGHFVSTEPYGMLDHGGSNRREFFKAMANPFDMKSVPSRGLWAKGEWANQNPELAAKRWLPPAFKNAIWGR